MSKINVEQMEAEQARADRENDEFVKSLPPASQAQFKAVKKAVEIMVKAKVPFYLFPQLESPIYKDRPNVWQYNSIFELAEKDNKGGLTENGTKFVSTYTEDLAALFFKFFSQMFNKKTWEEKLQYTPFFFHYCLNKNLAYNESGELRKKEKVENES